MKNRQSPTRLLHTGLIALTFASTALLTGCSDDDDDQQITDNANAIEYNGFVPILPEGMDYDPTRNAFILSSASTGAIGQVDKAGNYSTVIGGATFGGNGTFGIKVDEANNRLLAVSANLQDPTVGRLFIFDLSTMNPIRSVDLAALNGGLSFTNDVTLDGEGNAYVTNSDQGIIYKVDMAGNASIFLQNASFAPADPTTETGFNGIDYHPDGFLVVAHYSTNKIYRVPLADPSAIREINLPQGMVIEPDGIEVDGNQLAVVNLGRIAGSISLFNMNSDWSAGTPAGNTFPTGSIFPTAVTKADDGFYVNQSYFNFPAYSNNPTQYLVSKASFDSSVRYSGSATEIPRINTPVIPRGYGATYPAHFLADCTDGLAGGVPDMRGDWTEASVTINGETIPAGPIAYQERIEQCGNRVIVLSSGLIHDIYRADGTMYSGVNDINVDGQPIHSTGLFNGNTLTLTPVFPTALEITAPDVTRELMADDSGNDVLRFFNAALGRPIYMTR